MTPEELDKQSPVKIDKWIDVDSQESIELDQDRSITKRLLKVGFASPPFLFVDNFGRIWGKGDAGQCFPFHFEHGKKLIGYRISKLAAN